MKFFPTFLFVAAALAIGILVTGVTLDSPVTLALLFAATLAGWVADCYSRPVRRLTKPRVVHLPIARGPAQPRAAAARRMAA